MASLLVACGSTMSTATTGAATRVAVQSAKFSYVPARWRVFDRDFGLLSRSGASVESYALSWAYTPNSLGWADHMAHDGIAVSVILIRRDPVDPAADLCGQAPPLAGYPLVHHLPLELPTTTRATQEGQPNIPEYRVFGRLGNLYSIDLRVDINRAHPTRAMLRLAPAGRQRSALSALAARGAVLNDSVPLSG